MHSNQHLRLIAVVVALICSACAAQAQVFFRPSFMYTIEGSESSDTKSTNQRQLIDLAFGYIGSARWTLGGLYATERNDLKTQTGTEQPTETNRTRTSLGPSIGYTSDVGPYILITYLLQSEFAQSAVSYRGSGYQADVGLRFQVQQTHAAIQLSYKHYSYNKRYTNGSNETNLQKPEIYTFLDPYFVVFFHF